MDMKLKLNIYIALLGTALCFTACTAEQIEPQLPEENANSEAIVDEGEMTTFAMRGEDAMTRTYIDDHAGPYHFHWSVGDRVFLKIGSGLNETTDYLRARRSNITSADQWADFFFVGHFNANSYPVYYTGLEMHNTASSHLTEDGKLPNDNGKSPRKVTIAPVQVQYLPNQGQHLATSGDCATGTATKVADPSIGYDYEFTLTHRASYLIFKPYTDVRPLYGRVENGIDNAYCYLRKIKVESFDGSGNHQTISGTYNFGDPAVNTGGLDLTPANITDERDSILLYCNDYLHKPVISDGNGGYVYDWSVSSQYEIDNMDLVNKQNHFKLSNDKANALGLDMVIQPGTHMLRVTYTISYFQLQEAVYNTTRNMWEYFHRDQVKEITVDIPIRTYDENTYYVVQHELPIQDMEPEFIFDMYHYYQWGATESYWTGVAPEHIPNANNREFRFAPTAGAWADETNPLANNQATSAAFTYMPNANRMTYYIEYGDIHVGKTMRWWVPRYLSVPTLSRGGAWIKKWDKIVEDNPTVDFTHADEISAQITNQNGPGETPRDLRIYTPDSEGSNNGYRKYFKPVDPNGIEIGIPDESVRDNYFFLPFIGYYETGYVSNTEVKGKMKQMGTEGYYWTSTRYPKFNFTYNGRANRKMAYFLMINNKPAGSPAYGQYVSLSFQPNTDAATRLWYGHVAGDRYNNHYEGYRGIQTGGTDWFQ